MAGNYGIDLISMIAPTSKERIRKIAKGVKGFLYVVSSMGVTGERTNITTDIDGMLKEIRSVSTTFRQQSASAPPRRIRRRRFPERRRVVIVEL